MVMPKRKTTTITETTLRRIIRSELLREASSAPNWTTDAATGKIKHPDNAAWRRDYDKQLLLRLEAAMVNYIIPKYLKRRGRMTISDLRRHIEKDPRTAPILSALLDSYRRTSRKWDHFTWNDMVDDILRKLEDEGVLLREPDPEGILGPDTDIISLPHSEWRYGALDAPGRTPEDPRHVPKYVTK